MQPLMMNLLTQLEQVIVRMYADDVKIQNNGKETKNPFLPELCGKIKWISKEIFLRLKCGSDQNEWVCQFASRVFGLLLSHASLVRPLTEQMKLRMAGDATQVEYIFSQILQGNGLELVQVAEHESLRLFRNLLFMNTNDVPETHSLMDIKNGPDLPKTGSETKGLMDIKNGSEAKSLNNIKPESSEKQSLDIILICHHLICRTESIRLPSQLKNWSKMQYCDWIETAGREQVKKLLKQCLDEVDVANVVCIEHHFARRGAFLSRVWQVENISWTVKI